MQAQSFFVQQILLGVLLPAVSCGVSFLVLKSLLKKHVLTISIAIGFLAAYTGLSSFRFPPLTIQQWLPYLLAATLLLTLLEQNLPMLKNQAWLRWLVRLVLLNLWLYQLFASFLQGSLLRPARWGVTDLILNFTVISLLTFVFWWMLERVGQQKSTDDLFGRSFLPLALVLIGTASAASIALSHSLVTAQLNGALTAALGAVMVITWFWKDTELSSAALPGIAVLQAAFLINAYYFASLPWYVTALIVLSPLILFLLLQQASDSRRFVMVLLPQGIITIISILLAYLAG